MYKLQTLRAKRHDRVAKRKHHYAKYERFKKKNRKVRRNYQLRKFRRQVKAIKKYDRLIQVEEDRRAELRIDWRGLNPVGGPKLREVIRYGLNKNPGCYITSTNGGTHATTSHHYLNEAVDIGASTTAQKVKFQRDVFNKFGAGVFAELFGPDNWPWVKNGAAYQTPEGTSLEDQHDTHVHLAITS